MHLEALSKNFLLKLKSFNVEEAIKIALFQKREIRKVLYNKEWWFVIEDVVLALIDSANVKDYISEIRLRDEELSKGWGQIVHTLWMPTGKRNWKENS